MLFTLKRAISNFLERTERFLDTIQEITFSKPDDSSKKSSTSKIPSRSKCKVSWKSSKIDAYCNNSDDDDNNNKNNNNNNNNNNDAFCNR